MTDHATPTVQIVLDGVEASAVTLALSTRGCWTRLLGQWPMVADGSLDALAKFMDARAPTPVRATLRGCPSACLLPLLWLRTIWMGEHAALSIEWLNVEDPSVTPGRQAAGRLALLLASEVRCADHEAARRWWGWDASRPASIAAHAEAFDLLTNLIDLWGVGPRHATPAAGWAEAARKAIATCASMGLRRVALYGAGTHTRALGEVLIEPDVEIVGIIDDDARRHGARMWGYPIISPDAALELKPDAIILSANSIEDRLWEKTARHRAAGIRVARLYGGSDDA
jgi:hypothetical protein